MLTMNRFMTLFLYRICLVRSRYGWNITRLSNKCPCGIKFDIQHVLVCTKSSFIFLRHNGEKDITAKLLKEICSGVGLEPQS